MNKRVTNARAAFLAGALHTDGPDSVTLQTSDGLAVVVWSYHGSPIACRARLVASPDLFGNVRITLAGWDTVTTRRRLSSIADIRRVKGDTTLNGRPMAARGWYCLDGTPAESSVAYPPTTTH